MAGDIPARWPRSRTASTRPMLRQMRPRLAAVPLTVLALTSAAGCSHGKTDAQSGSDLATRVEMPASTPQWLIKAARRMATVLEDPHPDRVRIRVGRVAVIERWGDFTCGLCGSGPAPGGSPPQGWHAITRINPQTHREISFSL
jgi:hypothetical protein